MRQLAIREAGRIPSDLPVLYLSELLCLAGGVLPESAGLDRHFVDATHLAERSR